VIVFVFGFGVLGYPEFVSQGLVIELSFNFFSFLQLQAARDLDFLY